MSQEAFLTAWTTRPDAPPLILSGPSAALQVHTEALRARFAPSDTHVVAPVGKTITIKDVRAMRAVVGQRAWSGRRLIILLEAEKLSLPAAGALLRMLEEAGRTSRFVLVTRWYRRLLPTLRSRAEHIVVGEAMSGVTEKAAALPASLLERVALFTGEAPLPADVLEQINRGLDERLRQEGPSAALAGAYLRLRDYYRIAAEPGGNFKLARDVLLATLPDLSK